MNSLVVLFAVLSLAAAKPSGLIVEPVIAAAPAVAYAPAYAPAAVSSQSRVDIRHTPALVAKTFLPAPYVAAAAPIIAPAPLTYAAPAPITYAAPAPLTYAAPAPLTYAAPAPIAYAAPAAVSHSSRVDIASPGYIASAYAPVFAAHPGVPLDTPEVAAAKIAHFQAKALATHSLKKRSAVFAAPLTYAAPLVHSAPLISHATPLISHPTPLISYSAPLAYHTPLINKAYSIHPY